MKKLLLTSITVCSLGLATNATTSLAADTITFDTTNVNYQSLSQLSEQKNGSVNRQMCPLEGCGGGNFGLVGHQSGDPQHPGPMPHF